MSNSLLIISLALATLAIVAGLLVVERIGTSKAKDEHAHSAATEKNPELRDG